MRQRSGWSGESHRHSAAKRGITTVSESTKPYEYSKRYKYKVLQNFRAELESMKIQLEKQGFNVGITRDKYWGIVMSINEYEIQIYPNITMGNIGYIATDVKLSLPEPLGIQHFYLSVINNEIYKRGLMSYTKEWKPNYMVLTVESKKAKGTADSIDEVKKMVNVIRSIEEIKRR
jgi:hypothetical protein